MTMRDQLITEGMEPFDTASYEEDISDGKRVAVLTVGMSGSGKTHWTEATAVLSRAHHMTISRDEVRDELSDGGYSKGKWKFNRANEDRVTDVCQTKILAHFEAFPKRSAVWIHDTNLNPTFRIEYVKWLKEQAGVNTVFFKDLTDVDYELCVQRCADRKANGGRNVPKRALRDQYRRINPDYFKDYRVINIEQDRPFGLETDPGKRWCYIFDIDGTLAIHHNRSPHDETRVGEDWINAPIQMIYQDLLHTGIIDIIIVSGRSDNCRADTEEWLAKHGFRCKALHMRTDAEMRNGIKDVIVKRRILEEEILPHYNVVAVFDDRDQTVAGWRELGLTCLQVAPGDF